ncbi:MAG: class I SAM-dependent methyltransferase [Elusimicrobiota bacterium]
MKSAEIKCEICGSTHNNIILNIEPDKLVKCLDCGFYYKIPLPSENEIIDSFSSSASPEDKEEVWRLSKDKLFKEGLKKIGRLVKTKNKLLDVGCGHGYFLHLSQGDGWKEVAGMEISQTAAEFAKERFGINVYNKTLRETAFNENEFDCVTLWGVLYLIRHPVSEIKEIYRILKPGGILFIRITNANFHVFWAKKRWLTSIFGIYPEVLHAFEFSPALIKKILTDCGFEVLSIKNSRPTSGDPYGTSKYLKSWFVCLAKSSVYLFSECVRILSFGMTFTGSAIEVVAIK